jgi:hypothetical protein
MARTPTGRPVGRPKGTRTATVELVTLSFKAPKELVERVKRYAKQCVRPVSELVRDGLEWRIGEGDPLNRRVGVETGGKTADEGNTGNTDRAGVRAGSLHGMLSALVAEVRQVHSSVQALEQQLGRAEGGEPSGNIGITARGSGTPGQAGGQRRATGPASGEQTTRAWHARAFVFDPAKHTWGELCHKGHDREGGQSVREQANNECVDCRWERSTAYKARQREAKRQAQPA